MLLFFAAPSMTVEPKPPTQPNKHPLYSSLTDTPHPQKSLTTHHSLYPCEQIVKFNRTVFRKEDATGLKLDQDGNEMADWKPSCIALEKPINGVVTRMAFVTMNWHVVVDC